MFNLIFPSVEARVIDMLFADPHKKFSSNDIANRCNLKSSTVEKILNKLKLYKIVDEKNKNYFLQNNKTTNAYLIADIICRNENNDTIHDIFESDKKEEFYKDVKFNKV